MVADDELVMVAVDDAHLLDDGSAALLLHLATDTSVSVVATVRTGGGCPDAVASLWKEGVAERVDLQPLSEPQAVELVERVLGGPVDHSARRRLFSLTEGLPLYLREVVRAGLDQGVLANEDGTWRWRGNLMGSDRLLALMAAHMAETDGDERQVVELVALGEPVPRDVLGELVPRHAMAAAEAHGFILIDDTTGPSRVRLAHPLYGEVLRARLPTLVAQEHQRRLADAALATGWHEHEPLRAASWWLGSGAATGDPHLLLRAAERAVVLTEWDLAGRLAEAARTSGAGPEATLVRVVAVARGGCLDEAEALLTGFRWGEVDDEIMAEAVLIQASLLHWRRARLADARELLAQARERLTGKERARVVAFSAHVALYAGDTDDAVRLAGEAMTEAGLDRDARSLAIGVAALASAFQGRIGEVLDIDEVELQPLATPSDGFGPLAARTDWFPYSVSPVISVLLPAKCLALILAGRFREATELVEGALARLANEEDRAARTVVVLLAASVALKQGHLDRASGLAREALELTQRAEHGYGLASRGAAAVLASAAAQMGDPSEAAELERTAATRVSTPMEEIELDLARAWLAAARGESTKARSIAEQVVADAAAYAAPGVEALALVDLVRVGAPEKAVARLAALTPVVDGRLVRATAALATATVGHDGAALDRVSADFEAMDAVLFAAEAAAAAAGAHRRAGRRGSYLGSLGRARVLAARCGWPQTPALRDIDRKPALASLTGREREVVELAARGLTNREIATRLYVSIRTVHTHLCHAYAKLGLSDRDRLADLVVGSGLSQVRTGAERPGQ